MSVGYRKLTAEELESFGFKVNTKVKNKIKSFYPAASRLIVCYNSEYDDEYYQNTIASYYVLDINGNEIGLTRNNLKARNEIISLLQDEFCTDTSNEAKDDMVVLIDMPELYVKENNE